MPLQIRAMLESDLPAALQLWSATEGVEVAEGDSPSDLARYLRRNPGVSSVALDGDRLLGAVLCGHDGRRGFVYHLAVAADRRGQGIARLMMARSLQALKDEGLQRALLLVSADNSRGREFWLNQTWEEMPFAFPLGINL